MISFYQIFCSGYRLCNTVFIGVFWGHEKANAEGEVRRSFQSKNFTTSWKFYDFKK